MSLPDGKRNVKTPTLRDSHAIADADESSTIHPSLLDAAGSLVPRR